MRYLSPKFLLILFIPRFIVAEINAGDFTQYVLDFQKAYEENQSVVDLNDPNKVKSLAIAKLTVRYAGPRDKKADPNEIGHCEWVNSIPTVVLDPIEWNKDEKRKEMVIFHEFGHCVLDRRHCEGISPEGYPNSIMAKVSFDPATYYSNKKYYLQELFWTGLHRCGIEQTDFEEKINEISRKLRE